MKRSVVALSCAIFLTASFSAAEARPRHHKHPSAKHHVVKKYVAKSYTRSRINREYTRSRISSRKYMPSRVAQPQQEQSFFGGFQQSMDSGFSAGSGAVSRARQYIGATAREVGVRSSLWCSAFLRKVTGASGVDDRALSWEHKQRIAPQVGAIVTMSRGRRGGHVGIVSGFDANGNPRVISGNHGNRVAESVYPRSRIRGWYSAS
jgi:uncharacterized protein (TIGR02594 family)